MIDCLHLSCFQNNIGLLLEINSWTHQSMSLAWTKRLDQVNPYSISKPAPLQQSILLSKQHPLVQLIDVLSNHLNSLAKPKPGISVFHLLESQTLNPGKIFQNSDKTFRVACCCLWDLLRWKSFLWWVGFSCCLIDLGKIDFLKEKCLGWS